MTISIRASLTFSAVAMALLTAAFADPPESSDTLAGAPKAAQPDAHSDAKLDGLCAAGAQQSPIDLAGALTASAPVPVRGWKPVHGGSVVNTGHTIEVDVDGAGGLTLDGVTYTLQQFHFHHPSEHTIDGKSFPLELHLVHASADGKLAVIGVMFEEGAANPALDPVWATAPGREGQAKVAFEIDPSKLVPAGAAFRYEGSLTTPPCSETVRWTVMAAPQTASRAQINAFATMFPDNARPVQPLNRRYVLKTAG